MTTDPKDAILTPAHFLIGGSLLAMPEVDLSHRSLNHLTRWEFVRQSLHNFWKLWRTEYIQSLLPRSKWRQRASNLKKGDLVYIKGDSSPPQNWPLGVITDVHPAPDGQVRVVTIKTSHGEYVRSAQRIVRIPFD